MTIQLGTGWRSCSICAKIDSAMLLLPRQSRCPLGEGELIDEYSAEALRERGRLAVDGASVVDEMAAPAIVLDCGDLLRRRGARHHGIEWHADHFSEVGLRDRRRAGRGFDDGSVLANAAVAEGVKKEGAREAVLEAAGRVRRLV